MSDGPDICVERRIDAPPERVFAYLTDGALWARWQGASLQIEAHPGGVFVMTMPNDDVAEGRFVEVIENRRVVFTWGWRGNEAVPPGSSTVEIELVPDGDGTIVRLIHRGLPPETVAVHEVGWEHYIPRLSAIAAGRDPGPDRGPG